jgi:hypothetical protein
VVESQLPVGLLSDILKACGQGSMHCAVQLPGPRRIRKKIEVQVSDQWGRLDAYLAADLRAGSRRTGLDRWGFAADLRRSRGSLLELEAEELAVVKFDHPTSLARSAPSTTEVAMMSNPE